MITCDDDLACQTFVGREERKARLIGQCALLEEDDKRLRSEADGSAHVLERNCNKMPNENGMNMNERARQNNGVLREVKMNSILPLRLLDAAPLMASILIELRAWKG